MFLIVPPHPPHVMQEQVFRQQHIITEKSPGEAGSSHINLLPASPGDYFHSIFEKYRIYPDPPSVSSARVGMLPQQ